MQDIVQITEFFSISALAADASSFSNNEMQLIIAENEEHKRLVERKWNQAVEQAERESSEVKDQTDNTVDSITPFAYRSPAVYYNVSVLDGWMEKINCSFWVRAVYETSYDLSGNEKIIGVSGIYPVPETEESDVTNFDYQYVYIDQGKTIAVNFSAVAKGQASDGTWHSKPISGYIEYYFNGGAISH